MKNKYRLDISLPVDRLFFDLITAFDSAQLDKEMFQRALEAEAKLQPLDIWIEENLKNMLLGNRFGVIEPTLPPSFRLAPNDTATRQDSYPVFPEYATRWLTNPDSLHASIVQALADHTEDIEQA